MTMKQLMIFCAILILISCQPALINMPDCGEPIVREVNNCPYIPVPEKLPSTIHISIDPGMPAQVDSGGKKLLLNYRDMLKAIQNTHK